MGQMEVIGFWYVLLAPGAKLKVIGFWVLGPGIL